MSMNVDSSASPPQNLSPLVANAPSASLTDDEKKVHEDYEFALRDDGIRRQYAGQVVIVHDRQILGVGKTHRDAWQAAQRNRSCPSKQHVAMVVVPEAIGQ